MVRALVPELNVRLEAVDVLPLLFRVNALQTALFTSTVSVTPPGTRTVSVDAGTPGGVHVPLVPQFPVAAVFVEAKASMARRKQSESRMIPVDFFMSDPSVVLALSRVNSFAEYRQPQVSKSTPIMQKACTFRHAHANPFSVDIRGICASRIRTER